ncbi:MAG: hypothetical protein KA714_30590 [Limnoraphis sp. WC205]|nr:hypothetical protein [Limnoraphis sp. WC205]
MNEIDLIYWERTNGNLRVYERFCTNCNKRASCGILLVHKVTRKKPQEWTWGNIRGSAVTCISYDPEEILF